MSYTKRGPFVNASPTGPYVDADFFNNLETALTGATAQGVSCPPPTGVAATDTANIQAAITAAQATSQNLYLPPTNGVFYKLSTGISWDLTRGSLIGAGTDLDFGALSSGVALTIKGPGVANGTGYTAHRSHVNQVTSLNIQGYSSTPTIDGVLFDDSFAVDGATLTHTTINGFRDGITFGNNVWLIKCEKVVSMHHSRYAVNMTMAGNNSGENIAFYDCCFSAVGTGAASVYSPANNNTEVRFVACSFDYATLEGKIEGGNITFEACHIEDNGTGPMFTYSCAAGGVTAVAFRDCAWDSSTSSGVRDHIHEILPSPSSNITVTFDGDKGGVYPSTYSTWLVDNSGLTDLGITSTVRNFAVTSASGSNLLMGDFYNLLTNGSFADSSSFVAAPGVGGWTAGTGGTWSIGAGGQPGAGLTFTAATATTSTTSQRIPLPANRQAVRVAGKMFVSSYTAGNISLGVQFYAADGTTPVLGGIRIQNILSAVSTTWTQYYRRFMPPKGAAYMTVQLSAASFIGTGVWDQIEAVPV